MHAFVCMHFVLSAGTLKEVPVKVPFVIPELPVSPACLASCELHWLSRLLPRELHWSQQQNTQYFSAVPCDWEGERGRSHGWNAFSGTLPSPLWQNVNSSHFLPAGNLASDYTACPNVLKNRWFRWKFPSSAVFVASRMQCTWSSAAQRALPHQCFMHADALHKAETSNLNSTINFSET